MTIGKKTFASKTFASKTFASGTWRGVGVSVQPPDIPGVELSAGWQRPHYSVHDTRPHCALGWQRPHYEVKEEA